MHSSAHRIFINTILLTAAALAMRGAGLAFQVYLAGRIGASSIGVYSLIMSVYTMFVTLGSGGVRFAVTRLTAAAVAENSSVRKTVGGAVVYSLGFGCFSALCLFLCADFIAVRWIGIADCAPALKILAFSLPFISATAVFGGYFTGVERVVRSAAVNIGEQISRIFVTALLLNRFGGGLLYVCASLAAAALLGEAVSCLLHLILCVFDIRRFPKVKSGGGYGAKLFGTAMPIAVSAYMRTGLSSLGHILIPRGLRAYGAGFEQAFAAYGAIHGMAFPVLLFPLALLTALAELVIPRLTAAQTEGNQRGINYMATRVIKIGLAFSVCTAGIMFFFGDGLGQLIYNNADVGRYLRCFAPLVPVMYCDTITDGCLKGLGLHMKAMYINLAEATLNVILLYVLIPRCAVLGYGISIYVCEAFNFALSFSRLCRAAKINLRPKDVLKPLLAAAGAGFIALGFGLGTAASAVIAAAAYLPLLYVLGFFAAADVRWFCTIVRSRP